MDIALYLLELLFQTRNSIVIVLVNLPLDLAILLVEFFQLVIDQSLPCLELFIVVLFCLQRILCFFQLAFKLTIFLFFVYLFEIFVTKQLF